MASPATLVLSILCLGPAILLTAPPALATLTRNTPFRLRLPKLTDIVFVNEVDDINILDAHELVGRLGDVPISDLPGWAQLFFKRTRFYHEGSDKWSLPFTNASDEHDYAARLAEIESRLATGYTPEDVIKTADLVVQNSSDITELATHITNVVGMRFTGGAAIPTRVVAAARATLNSPEEINKAPKAQNNSLELEAFIDQVHQYNNTRLLLADVKDALGTAAIGVADAVKTLASSPQENITALFTIPKNCPTSSVPRIALGRSRFGGLLRLPSTPKFTVFMLSISRAAGKTGDLFWTFGTGTPVRACPFKPFFESFMGDLRGELLQRKAQSSQP